MNDRLREILDTEIFIDTKILFYGVNIDNSEKYEKAGVLLDDAFQIQKRFLLSFWDSLILAAAQQTQCSYVVTEDLNHGQKYGKLIATNPFHSSFGN
jgi:predicted nucleic acid-binding protein